MGLETRLETETKSRDSITVNQRRFQGSAFENLLEENIAGYTETKNFVGNSLFWNAGFVPAIRPTSCSQVGLHGAAMLL